LGWKERFEAKLTRWGEECLKNGTTAFPAFVRPLDQAFWNLYFDAAEAAFLARPGLMLLVSPDLTITTSDSVTYDGVSYPVRKLWTTRIDGDAVVKTVLCAQTAT
jgi:hypothetical protein